MHDAVSQALFGRDRDPKGLSRTVTISAAVHVALMAFIAFGPSGWFARPLDTPRNVMTISLAGSTGPRNGGLTPIGARPVQQVVPEAPKAQPTRPPAAKTPEMTEPEVKPRTPPKQTSAVREAPTEARSRTPTTGTQERQGKAAAETGSQSNTMGLSTGGTPGTGGQLNLGDFCCPEWISAMLQKIHQNWNSRQQSAGLTTMRFTIQRDGTVTDIQVARSSGNQMLDFLAQRALLAVRQFQPLPAAYTNPTLVVNLDFEYQR
jgi:TonB family protein